MTSATERRVTAAEWELWLREAVSYLEPEHRAQALEAGRKVKPGAVVKAHAAILKTLPDAELLAIIQGLRANVSERRG